VVYQRPAHAVLDVRTPNVARMYDYLLGGKDNFAADRAAADQLVAAIPDLPFAVRANRAFLARAVRFLVESGIRQFIDIGAGLPTQGNVHEIAHQAAPDARVVYVDNDPVVLSHGRALLADDEKVHVTYGDLRRPGEIINGPEVRNLIDFDEPVAVLLLAVLHYLPDSDDPYGSMTMLREAVAPGSYVAVSHATPEPRPEVVAMVDAVHRQATSPLIGRHWTEVLRMVDGFELVPPGLVYAPCWRPDSLPPMTDPERTSLLAAIGLRP
jgi:SAM-dependent methyltransferase